MSKRAKLLKRLLTSRRLGSPLNFSLDRLEERQLMSTVTWIGTGLTSNWSDGANWDTSSAPQAGDTLLFPATSSNYASVDDLPSGFTIGSIQFTGGNYHLTGNSFTLQSGLSITPDGIAQIDNDISTPANTTITISETGSPQLILAGVLSIGNGGTINASIYSLLELTGSAATTTGSIQISHGTAIVSGNYANAFGIASTGHLLNEGTVGAVANHGGQVMAVAFTVDITGDLTQDAGSNLALNYEGSGLNSNLVVDGDVTLAGTLSATFYYTPSPGESLTVINNAGTNPVTGTFDNLPEGATVSLGGNDYTISYQGGDGNDVILTRPAPPAAPSLITLTAGDPISFGQIATFSATVTGASGTPTGTVTLMDGTDELDSVDLDENGVATLSRSWLPVGAHSITAVYSGDDANAGSTSLAVSQVVTKADTATTVTASSDTLTPNSAVTFTATVVGNLNVNATPLGGRPLPTTTGTVSFYDGATLLGSVTLTGNVGASPLAQGLPRTTNGVVTFTTSTLAVGTHQITAIYSGDDSFSVSTSDPTPVTVQEPAPPAVTAALTNVQSPGAAKYIFTLTFTDPDGVNILPLISNPTVFVTGPGRFAQMAKFLGVTTTSAGLRTVTFQITPPGGAWDANDAGTYTVHVAANAVKDGQGNWLGATTAGTFSMAPTPFFDERFYLAHNTDVAAAVNAGIQSSGYAHFLGWGQFEGRDPSAVYNEKRYLAFNPDVAKQVKAGMFKSGFDQLIKAGITQHRQVSAFFNEQYYLANNPDVAAQVKAGTYRSGLEQFLLVGQFQARNPSAFFSDAYYRAQNPSITTFIQSGQFASDFEHFLESGQQQGLAANTFFNEQFYLTSYPTVAAAVTAGQFQSGLEHYILYGQAAGYRPNASATPRTH